MVATSSDGLKTAEAESEVRGRNFSFRHVIPVPRFIVKTIIESGQSLPEDERLMAIAAGKQWLEENEDLSNIFGIKHESGDIIYFL